MTSRYRELIRDIPDIPNSCRRMCWFSSLTVSTRMIGGSFIGVWNAKTRKISHVRKRSASRGATRNESGIGNNVSRPRAFSALSPTRATLMDALIGGISRGMRRKDRSYYQGAENRCVLNTKNVNYVITAAGTVKHDITCKSIASAVNNFRVSLVTITSQYLTTHKSTNNWNTSSSCRRNFANEIDVM